MKRNVIGWSLIVTFCFVMVLSASTLAIEQVQVASDGVFQQAEVSVALPTQPQEGNLLVAVLGARSAFTEGFFDGWELVAHASNRARQWILYKWAGAEEESTITFNFSGVTNYTLTVVEYAGVSPDSPVAGYSNIQLNEELTSLTVGPLTGANGQLALAAITVRQPVEGIFGWTNDFVAVADVTNNFEEQGLVTGVAELGVVDGETKTTGSWNGAGQPSGTLVLLNGK